MYEFIGARYIDMVSRKTGRPVQSYIFWFAPVAEVMEDNEIGRIPVNKWVTPQAVQAMGGLVAISHLVGSVVEPVLDLRGQLVAIKEIKK